MQRTVGLPAHSRQDGGCFVASALSFLRFPFRCAVIRGSWTCLHKASMFFALKTILPFRNESAYFLWSVKMVSEVYALGNDIRIQKNGGRRCMRRQSFLRRNDANGAAYCANTDSVFLRWFRLHLERENRDNFILEGELRVSSLRTQAAELCYNAFALTRGDRSEHSRAA